MLLDNQQTAIKQKSVGLLGGSFNPAHNGHRHISLRAMKELGLNEIWWLITPGNPLKDTSILADENTRVENAKIVADHPRIKISTFESKRGFVHTYDTLKALTVSYPHISFTWLMGADNLAQFHKWKNWRKIAHLVPMAVIDRPEFHKRSLTSPAATILSKYRMSRLSARGLAFAKPPRWTFLHGPKSPLSSTLLRRKKETTRAI